MQHYAMSNIKTIKIFIKKNPGLKIKPGFKTIFKVNYLTFSDKSEPALNLTTFLAAILISFPV
jgi:hypothetical protein